MESLRRAFLLPSSLFEVKMTEKMGFGVFARKEMDTKFFNNQCTQILCGSITTTYVKENSHSDIMVSVWTRGNSKNAPSSEPKDEKRNMVGPITFVNHACDFHAQLVFAQETEAVAGSRKFETGKIFLKMEQNSDNVEEGEEIFCCYGENYDGVSCSLCNDE